MCLICSIVVVATIVIATIVVTVPPVQEEVGDGEEKSQ